jgi:hypothetical protein
MWEVILGRHLGAKCSICQVLNNSTKHPGLHLFVISATQLRLYQKEKTGKGPLLMGQFTKEMWGDSNAALRREWLEMNGIGGFCLMDSRPR